MSSFLSLRHFVTPPSSEGGEKQTTQTGGIFFVSNRVPDKPARLGEYQNDRILSFSTEYFKPSNRAYRPDFKISPLS